MHILIVFAHPTRASFCGSILNAMIDELQPSGHETEVLDLYAEAFNPVLSLSEWEDYESKISSETKRYADQIQRSDGIVWIFPTWNYGLPAILKGYIDRVWVPNVAFSLDEHRNVRFSMFAGVKFFNVITTFGASWIVNTFLGNPCRRVLAHCLRRHFSPSCNFLWLALYRLDKPSPDRLRSFLEKVRLVARSYSSRSIK